MNAPTPTFARAPIGFAEFVTFVASLMAINAMGIDIILPALPAIGTSLGIADENSRQLIIACYMLGFGAMQIVYGPLADRFGRRPVLLCGLLAFVATSLFASFATDFLTIVAARTLQGMTAATSRVLAVSMVRDRFSGRQMARVMSLTFIVFLAVPILAPTLGQMILYIAPWEAIFYALAIYGALVAVWGFFRIPETLHAEDRRAIAVRPLLEAARLVLTNRYSLGYTIAMTLLFAGLMGFIMSVQQIFYDVFRRPDIFTYVFALVASGMAVASFANSRIVERLGTRFVSHWALIGFVTFGGLHTAWALAGLETVWSFSVFQTGQMMCFALAASNFGAMAMEPVGHIAGTASSIQGTASTIGGALLGLAIGQSFDGTTLPVAIGYLLLGLASLTAVAITERGRLFRSHPVAQVEA
ncbi:multidrug effflux MFS transporter [Sphingomonas sp. 1P06PA]|uniref:multidrug effflux MFS transporter n=1 Tax=Sphingomonas sp. 1P06PA TaxID=554121 RepID=UPI0039A4E817